MIREKTKSQVPIKIAKTVTLTITTSVEPIKSFFVGQETLLNSTLTSLKKLVIFAIIITS